MYKNFLLSASTINFYGKPTRKGTYGTFLLHQKNLFITTKEFRRNKIYICDSFPIFLYVTDVWAMFILCVNVYVWHDLQTTQFCIRVSVGFHRYICSLFEENSLLLYTRATTTCIRVTFTYSQSTSISYLYLFSGSSLR